LDFIVDSVSYRGYDPAVPTDNKQFYDMMRDGKVVMTTLASVSDAEMRLRDCFESGQDALYLGFDSALSAHYDVMSAHMERVQTEFYPDRKLRCIDTLAAAMGQGLIVADAVKQREAGMGLDELADWVVNNRLDYGCWFTVDDLKYLQRGGRLTAGAAFAGTLLSIKPVLHIDNEGRLVPMEKLRGRKRALQFLADTVNNSICQPTEGSQVFISHADCREDCELLRELIQAQNPGLEFISNNLDPVIGAHAGPGTVAVFFHSSTGRG
jgi:DegV family protein with EDD domain